ncbi:MAG: hypothetical protein V4558_08855 [Gemmatimonadota bacterium]
MRRTDKITAIATLVTMLALFGGSSQEAQAQDALGGACIMCVESCNGVNPTGMCQAMTGCGAEGQCINGTATGCDWDTDSQDERIFCFQA